MKLSRISFALVICALFGMTGCGNVPQTIPDTTSDESTTTEPTTTEPTWKSIEYTPEKEFVDYDYGKESKATKKVIVTALIPDTWVSGSEIENDNSYVEWDSDLLVYKRRLEIPKLYRITDISLFNEATCGEHMLFLPEEVIGAATDTSLSSVANLISRKQQQQLL